MTETEARNLLRETIVVREVVIRDCTPVKQLGTVKILGHNKFLVDWSSGLRQWIDYKDAKKLSMR